MYSNASVRGWPLTFKILNYRTVQVVIADVVQREGGSKRSAALATIEASLCYELRYRAANYSVAQTGSRPLKVEAAKIRATCLRDTKLGRGGGRVRQVIYKSGRKIMH